MFNNLNQWRKKHRDRTDLAPFKNRPHPIQKRKYPDRTEFYCLRCRDKFVKFEINKINPKKMRVWKKDSSRKSDTQIWMARCDKLWVKYIKLRADNKSELFGKGISDMCFLDAHHIEGKSTLRLRYSLFNGVLITRLEHSDVAHSNDPAVSKSFKDWALDLRNSDENKIIGDFDITFGQADPEEIETYLKENVSALKSKNKNSEKIIEVEMFFP